MSFPMQVRFRWFVCLLLACVSLLAPSISSAQGEAASSPARSAHNFANCHEMQLQLASARGELSQTEYNHIFQLMQVLPDPRQRRRCAEDLSYWDLLNANFTRAALTIDFLHQHQADLPSEHLRCLNAAQLIGAETSSRMHSDEVLAECPTTMTVAPRLEACHFDPPDPMDERVQRQAVETAARICRDHDSHDEHNTTHPIADRLAQLGLGGTEEAVRLYRSYAADLPWGAADAILLASLEHAQRELANFSADPLAIHAFEEQLVRGREYLERLEIYGEDSSASTAAWTAPRPTALIVRSAMLAMEAWQRLHRPRQWCEFLESAWHPSTHRSDEHALSALEEWETLFAPGQDHPIPEATDVARLFIREEPEVIALSRTQGRVYIESWCGQVLGHSIAPVTLPPQPTH